MERIKILGLQIEKLEKQLEVLGTKKFEASELRNKSMLNLLREYFDSALEEGDTLEINDLLYVYFKRPDSNYNKEILSLTFKTHSLFDYNSPVVEIETNFYSTSENSEFELRRMILLGNVASIILDKKADIIKRMNKIIQDSAENIKSTSKEFYKLERRISSIRKFISESEKKNLYIKVEKEGIQLKLDDGLSYTRYPNLEISHSQIIYNVSGLKITSKSSSGRTLDVEVIHTLKLWNVGKEGFEIKTVCSNMRRVKRERIEDFINRNRNIIL